MQDSKTLIEYIPERNNPPRISDEFLMRFPNEKMPNINLLELPIELNDFQKSHLNDLSNIIPMYILFEYGNTKKQLVEKFSLLNTIRNKLDFTHSNRSILWNQTIEKGRNELQAIEDCKDMFKLLYFLLTETELK